MTVEELAEELTDDGDVDVDRAVQLHNDVIRALSENIEGILADLDLADRHESEIGPDVLAALVEYMETEASAHVVALLSSAAQELQDAAVELPQEQADLLAEMAARIADARSVDELRGILEEYEAGEQEAVAQGSGVGRLILEKGEDDIYDEDSRTAEVTENPDDPAGDGRAKAALKVAGADTIGAAKGAAVGVWVYGVGAVPAAIGGAASGSAASVAIQAWNRLVDRS